MRVKFRLLFFAATFFLGSAHAERSQHELWVSLMNGTKIPMKIAGLENWVEPSPQCERQVKSILKTIESYGTSAYQSRSKISEKVGRSFYQTFLDLHQQKDRTCFNEVSRAYLLGSIWISDRWSQSGKSGYVNGLGCEQFSCSGTPENIYLLLLSNALLKAKKIQFVVPTRCDFTYNCKEDVVRLNPMVPPKEGPDGLGGSPEDFVGHYLHELDHQFRYKFVNMDYVRTHFKNPNDPSQIDWKSFLLLDEVLSKLISATTQIANQMPSRFDVKPPNQIENDFSLYLKDGPLEKLMKEHFKDTIYVQSGYLQFLRETFLGPQSLSDWGSIQEVYGILDHGYFKSSTADQIAIRPENQNDAFDPLAYRLAMWTPGSGSQKEMKLPDREVIRFKDVLGRVSDTVIPLTLFLKEIETVIHRPVLSEEEEKNSVCSQLASALTLASTQTIIQNPLAGYYGLSCPNLSVLENGVRTDDGMVNPENGVRTDDPSLL